MRKFSLCFVILLISGITFGQSWHYRYYAPDQVSPIAPQSPLLNTESDLSGINDAGWVKLLDSSKSAEYSKTVAIPFPFNFAGNTVTHFRVASTGFITFDTSVTGIPSAAVENLPSNKLPQNSICVWGLNTKGDNDQVIYKVFGTIPNRQLWIKFASCSTPGDTLGSWNYWSVVLNENNDHFFITGMHFDQATGKYKSPDLALGLQEDNTNAYMVERNRTNNFTRNSDKPTDNFYYEFSYGSQLQYDLNLQSLYNANLWQPSTASFNAGLVINNLGKNTIDSVNILYRLNNGSIKSKKVNSGIQLKPNGVNNYYYNLNDFTSAIAGKYDTLQVWLENANGAAEINKNNDSGKLHILLLNNTPVRRKLLIEESAATWCGICPMADFRLNELKDRFGDTVVIVQHHSQDEMAGNGDSIVKAYHDTMGAALLNRSLAFNQPDWMGVVALNTSNYTPAIVKVQNVKLDTITRIFSFDVKVTFTDFHPGAIRVGGIALEDKVRGTGTGFQQTLSDVLRKNIHNPFYGMASPIIGYYHNNVAWNLPGGTDGKLVKSPNGIYKPGDVETVSFSYKYPALLTRTTIVNSPYYPQGITYSTGKPMSMKAAGFVTSAEKRFGNYVYLNADEAPLWNLTTSTDKVANGTVKVYPNPNNGNFMVSVADGKYDAQLFNVSGIKMVQENLRSENGALHLDLTGHGLPAGIYFLHLQGETGQIHRTSLIIQ